MSDDRNSTFVLLFVLFLLLINFPMLTIFDRKEIWWGFPALYFYLFFVWAAVIAAIAWLVRSKKR